jgi:hypothetical protein
LLTTGNPVLGFLDVTKLLNDLVNHTMCYCSSFLFHVIMALACVCSHLEIPQNRLLTCPATIQRGRPTHSTLRPRLR